MSERYDAVVVGAGPNGLSAAVEIARSGARVLVLEAADEIGGGCRTAELTLPGFRHDVCAAIHPTGAGSPFFEQLPLGSHGLEWVHPDLPTAHPLDGGNAAVLARSVTETADRLGPDRDAYLELLDGMAANWAHIRNVMLGKRIAIPRPVRPALDFGRVAALSAEKLASRFETAAARALIAGMAGHSITRLDQAFTGGVALGLLITGHSVGWPAAKGGSGRLPEALASYLADRGGEIRTGHPVDRIEDVPEAQAVLLDVTPRQLLTIAGDRLPKRYRRSLARYRYGPGVFKLDLALAGPIPWAAEECSRAGTIHLGGTFEEIARAEAEVMAGGHPKRPFVLLAQQSMFDPTRAPDGKHTVWAYCHVPNGSTVDMTDAIERQIERFAPGFRDRIIGRHTMATGDYQIYNRNNVGGDISNGDLSLRQLLFRPAVRLDPYRTPADGVYLCSAATPPGPGVHGMSGYYAASSALKHSL